MDLFPRVCCGRSVKASNRIRTQVSNENDANLGDGLPEYFLVGFLSYLPVVVRWLEDQFDFLYNPVLPLHFLQELVE